MDILGDHLDSRDATMRAAGHQRARDTSLLLWLNNGIEPETRLLKFDAWARQELTLRIDWAWAGSSRPHRIEQCRLMLERLVLDLWRRGWMLDGHRLAKHITTCLDDIAAAQKADRVKEFWPFFKSVVNRYVGVNSEELQVEALQAGVHVGQMLCVFGVKSRSAVPGLPDLIAQRHDETLREKLARKRRQEAAKAALESTPQLF
jgi:hypothetical protein